MKEGWWGSQWVAVEWSRRHKAVLLVLDLPLQFHPPVLKPGLDLSNIRKEAWGARDRSVTLLKQTNKKLQTAVARGPLQYLLCVN